MPNRQFLLLLQLMCVLIKYIGDIFEADAKYVVMLWHAVIVAAIKCYN